MEWIIVGGVHSWDGIVLFVQDFGACNHNCNRQRIALLLGVGGPYFSQVVPMVGAFLDQFSCLGFSGLWVSKCLKGF